AQVVEVKATLVELEDLSKCAKKPNFMPNLLGYDISCVVVLLIFAFVMPFFSFNLYKEFGWNVYKIIGADLEMQRIYRDYLNFLMLLNLNLLFIFMIPLSINTLVYNWQDREFTTSLIKTLVHNWQDRGFMISSIICYLVVTVLTLILERLKDGPNLWRRLPVLYWT
ncbi:23157_t:CDS:2, partial [Racocetra persica]